MKQRKTFVLLTAACLAAFTFIACSKSDKKDDQPETPKEEPGKIPGFGKAEGTPQGTALVYPAGVTLSGAQIYGEVCDTAHEVGSGGIVEICIALVNNNAADVTFTLPLGLVVLADDAKYQHGLLLNDARIVLKAKRTTRVGVKMWCLNSQKLGSAASKTYKIGPVTNSTLIRNICEQLKNKKTSKADYADEMDYVVAGTRIQNMIWAYTDGNGYDAETFAQVLASIPNK